MKTDDDPDKFAAHLRAQPPAPLPAPWRAEILAAARTSSADARPPRWRAAAETLAAWLWPHPYAYAGLLAVWLLVLTLRRSTPASAPFAPPQSWASGDASKADYQAALTRELLAINAVFADPSKPAEGRP